MPFDTMLDERGRAVETITATEAKNAFGRVLDTALSRGVVAITKREKVHAVVLSVEAYDALVNNSSRVLAGLESEFDALVTAMQTPRARAAGDALFAAKPARSRDAPRPRPPGSVPDAPPRILVLAGTNGAGKSSIGGAFLRRGRRSSISTPTKSPGRCVSPTRASTPRRPTVAPGRPAGASSSRPSATATTSRSETTLGGRTITGLLLEALRHGFEVRVWYAGLATPELHVARVATRVRRGGHDIPEPDIRRRYDESRRNLVVLLPHLTELAVYDNSAEGDPALGKTPQPVLVLQLEQGTIVGPPSLGRTPAWARPISRCRAQGRSPNGRRMTRETRDR